jgi:hypothetical protein
MPPALFADLGKTPKGEANLVQDHHEKKKKKKRKREKIFFSPFSPAFSSSSSLFFFCLVLVLLPMCVFPFRCLSFSTDKRKKKMPRQKINFFFLFFPLLLQTCSPRTSRRIWK